jgi:hypothetical protein
MPLGAGHAPQRLRRLTESAEKGAAHPLRIAEADLGCDVVDRLAACLYSFARRLNAQALDGLSWRDPRFSREGTGKMARAHRRLIGQSLDAKGLMESLARRTQ